MADSWDSLPPEDSLLKNPDARSYWYNDQLHGERLDPNALGIYGTPNPTNYLDRTPPMNSDVGGRMARELYKLYQSGQLGDDEAYKGFMGESRGYSDETILDALRRQGGSYLTRISNGGGAAPPNEARGLRDEDNIKRFNELEGESGSSRFQAYRDWQSQATPEELRDQALEGGYRTPANLSLGYAEGDKMPLPASRNPGINALIDEQTTRGFAPPREQSLVEALHGARSGLPRSMSAEDLTNYMSGQPISDNYLSEVPPAASASNAIANVQSPSDRENLLAEIARLQERRDQARSRWDISQQLEAQRKYNSEYGERDRIAQENLASRFPSWGGFFDPRPMAGAIGRTFDPRPLGGFLDFGLNKLHSAVFPPAY